MAPERLPVELNIITVPQENVSREPGTARGELRPEFTAESMSTAVRRALALLTLLWAVLSPVAAALVLYDWPTALDQELPRLTGIVAFIALGGLLYLVYGALLANNRAVGPVARAWWFLSMVFGGPLGMLFYWSTHVAPAPSRPRRAGS